MKIISISGVDGSGKTTQLKLLKNHLEQNGNKVLLFHAISFSLANRISSLFSKNKNETGKSKTKAGFCSIFARKIFLIIDVWRFRGYSKKIEKQDFTFLLTDRYFFDQIANILFLEKKSSVTRLPLWLQIVESSMIKPSIAFYLKTNPHLAADREREIEQGIEYLKAKSIIYDLLFENWQKILIDGNSDPQTIHETIINHV